MALRMKQSISVVFPAYNEEANISKMVKGAIRCLKTLTADWEIIVVNDGSQDRTGQIVDALTKEDFRVRHIRHEKNLGYGAALKSGIQNARKELIFFSDSDLQFHLSELLILLVWVEQYDIVVGYRANRQDPFYRRFNAWGWKLLVRSVLGLKVRDIDCAFKLFRSVVFDAIQIDAVGAMVNTDILVQATRMGFKIREVPVTHFPRLRGTQTGANLKVIRKAFGELFRLYWKLKNVRPVVFERDPIDDDEYKLPENGKWADERKVLLPINFPDRRQRVIRFNGTAIPLSSWSSSSEVFNAKQALKDCDGGRESISC